MSMSRIIGKTITSHTIVLTGPPSSRPDLVYFAYHITKDVGSMICGEVLQVRGRATHALFYAFLFDAH